MELASGEDWPNDWECTIIWSWKLPDDEVEEDDEDGVATAARMGE